MSRADILEMEADYFDARADLIEAVLSFGQGQGAGASEVAELAHAAEKLFFAWREAKAKSEGAVYIFQRKAG